MSDPFFSGRCNHDRMKRIDNNFIKCTKCGHSVISQVNQLRNKTRHEFTTENKSFQRNFERNFTNVLSEVEKIGPVPLEYYTDVNNLNYVIVDRTVLFDSNPPKFKINFNGNIVTVTNDRLNDSLQKIRAIRIDEQQFNYVFGNKIRKF